MASGPKAVVGETKIAPVNPDECVRISWEASQSVGQRSALPAFPTPGPFLGRG